MFKAELMFAGVKEITSKEGKNFKLIRFLDEETGDYLQLFIPNNAEVPSNIPIFTKVKVSVTISGRNINLEKVERVA